MDKQPFNQWKGLINYSIQLSPEIHDVIGLTLFLFVVVNTGSVLKPITQLMKQFLP